MSEDKCTSERVSARELAELTREANRLLAKGREASAADRAAYAERKARLLARLDEQDRGR
jgi:hypothetical protein